MTEDAFKRLVRQSFCKMDFKPNGDCHAHFHFGRVVIKGYWMKDSPGNPALVGELIDMLCEFCRKTVDIEND